MSKTYNLTAMLNTGRLRKTDWISDNWTNFYTWNEESSNRGYAGQDDPWYYATNMIFDSATLNTLRNKTVTAVTLTVNVTQAMTGESYIAYKYNSTTSGSSTSGAWTRSTNGGSSPSASSDSIAYTIPAQSLSTGTKTFTLKTAVPVYGLVAGPRDTVNGRWRFTSATLNVTTNETDYNYTLAYNANGGSGAPSNQTGSNTGTSPYYTFTVSSTVPTRTGYTFLGWSTSSSATSASYVGGNSFTVTSSGTTTLYAVWKANTYTVSYNANGGTGAPANQTKTYNEPLTLRATIPTRTNYTFQGWATSSTGTVAYQPSGSYTTNAPVTLYAIWYPSIAVFDSVTDEIEIGKTNGGTVSWTNAISDYHYWVKVTINSAYKWYLASGTAPTSLTITIPSNWVDYAPNSTSIDAVVGVYTYLSDDTTLVGHSDGTCKLTVAASEKPSISSFTVTPRSSNSTVDGWGSPIQGYSYISFSVSATAGSGASILSYAISGEGISYSGSSNSANSAVITTSGQKDYTLTVTDSRGRKASTTGIVYFLAYSNPSVNSLVSYRSNSSGDQADIDGTYIHSTPSFTYSNVSHNVLTVKKIEYKLHTASSWTSAVDPVTTDIGYTFGNGNIAITSSYDVKCTVTDSLGNSGTYTVLVPPIVGFAVGLNNDRARFGGPVEKAGLQVDWDAEFNGVVDVVPRRCYASLPTTGNSSGWYRVMEYSTSSQATAMGGLSFVVDFVITRANNATNNETHCISLVANYNDISFTNESSKSNTCIIDEIRFTNNGATSYVDIHYNTSGSNWVCVDATVHVAYDHLGQFKIKEPTKTADSPVSPETEVTVYTFSANVGPTYLKQYVETTAANYTIGSGNYLEMDYPLNLTGNQVVSIGLATWSTNSGPFAVFPYGTSLKKWYIVGAAGTTINGARFKYWYID